MQSQEDKKKAMDMRQKAMETYGETRKRKDVEGEDDSSRRTSFDMRIFLREKLDRDSEMNRAELEAREHNREAREYDIQAREKERLDILK